MVAHVGFVEDGQPLVIPLSYYYDPSKPDLLYLHGGVKSRIMANLANGAPVCVTVTLLDGLVYSRKAMNHSMNYRSVVLLDKAWAITDRQDWTTALGRPVEPPVNLIAMVCAPLA